MGQGRRSAQRPGVHSMLSSLRHRHAQTRRGTHTMPRGGPPIMPPPPRPPRPPRPPSDGSRRMLAPAGPPRKSPCGPPGPKKTIWWKVHIGRSHEGMDARQEGYRKYSTHLLMPITPYLGDSFRRHPSSCGAKAPCDGLHGLTLPGPRRAQPQLTGRARDRPRGRWSCRQVGHSQGP